MAFGAPPRSDRVDGRAVAGLLVSAAGLAACITAVILAAIAGVVAGWWLFGVIASSG